MPLLGAPGGRGGFGGRGRGGDRGGARGGRGESSSIFQRIHTYISFSQVVASVEVVFRVGADEEEEEAVTAADEEAEAGVPHEAGVVVVVDVAVPEEAPTPSSNPTDTLVSSSPKAKSTSSSRKTSSQANLCTERNGYLSRAASTVPRSSTGCGILSGVNWLLGSWVVWMIFSLRLEKRCCISVLRAERV